MTDYDVPYSWAGGGNSSLRPLLIDVISLRDLCCAVVPRWLVVLPVHPRLGPYSPFGQGFMIYNGMGAGSSGRADCPQTGF